MAWPAPLLRGVQSLGRLIQMLAESLANLFRDARQRHRVVVLPFGATVRPSGSVTQVQRIEIPDATDFTVANPSNPREGVELTLVFLNQASGSIGTVTFGSEYSLDGDFVAPPADGHASYTFLRTTDGKWREVERSAPAVIIGPPPGDPVASFTYRTVGLTVTFTNTSAPPPGATLVSYLWNFGDGATSTAASPSHTYGSSGTRTVTLTVTDSNSNSDVESQSVTVASGSTATGLPWGISNWFADSTHVQTTPNGGTNDFNMAHDSVTPSSIIARLDACANMGLDTMLNLTGGSHNLNFGPNGIFDINVWKSRMNAYNTAPIKAAVAAAVARAKGTGRCLGNSVIDEPNNASWGPTGTITKPMLDEMARYGRAIFPTLPEGVVGRYDWRESEHYTDVDFGLHQYAFRLPIDDPGNVALFISRMLAQDAADGIATVTGFNYSGGWQVPYFPTMTAAGPSASGSATINLTAGISKPVQAGTQLVFEPGHKKAILQNKAFAGNSALTVQTPHDAISTGDVCTAQGCPQPMTLGPGTTNPPNPLCRVTAKQAIDCMTQLAAVSVGARIWWYNSPWLDLAEIRDANHQIRLIMDSYSMPATGWNRP